MKNEKNVPQTTKPERPQTSPDLYIYYVIDDDHSHIGEPRLSSTPVVLGLSSVMMLMILKLSNVSMMKRIPSKN
jgi:hypothetical protein